MFSLILLLMMNIKAIIFDVGGVLHSSEIAHIYTDIKRTLKISDQQVNQHYYKLVKLCVVGAIIENEFWRRFLKKTGSMVALPKESLFK